MCSDGDYDAYGDRVGHHYLATATSRSTARKSPLMDENLSPEMVADVTFAIVSVIAKQQGHVADRDELMRNLYLFEEEQEWAVAAIKAILSTQEDR